MWKLPLWFGIFVLLTACKSSPHQSGTEVQQPESPPAATEVEPIEPIEVKEPTFTITSITIIQADLINTRLKLSLKIDNPNTFPITLVSFRYELYGDGSFWTSGREKDLAIVPARGSSETGFEFEMNFIGMKRRLLDDIIAMKEVHYRIAGDMELETDISQIPGFRLKFDFSGKSPVKH
jgi:LEA14-like dessication related protein